MLSPGKLESEYAGLSCLIKAEHSNHRYIVISINAYKRSPIIFSRTPETLQNATGTDSRPSPHASTARMSHDLSRFDLTRQFYYISRVPPCRLYSPGARLEQDTQARQHSHPKALKAHGLLLSLCTVGMHSWQPSNAKPFAL